MEIIVRGERAQLIGHGEHGPTRDDHAAEPETIAKVDGALAAVQAGGAEPHRWRAFNSQAMPEMLARVTVVR